MPILHQAIQALKPNNEFTMIDDDPKTIIWNDENVITPSDAEINAKFEELKIAEVEAEKEKAAQKQAILNRLGITEDEAKLLLA